MMNRSFILQLFIVLNIFLFFSCQTQNQLAIIETKISDRISVFSCLDVNISVISTQKGLVIIDTHRSPSIMSEIREEIRKTFGDKEIVQVINTHAHYDHSSGNQNFTDSIIVGHENCPLYMHHNPANTLRNEWYFKNRIQKLEKQFKDTTEKSLDKTKILHDINGWKMVLSDLHDVYKISPPKILFKDSLYLDMGDILFQLYYCGNSHTNNHIFIYIPQEKTVFTGDMFNSENSLGFYVNKVNDISKLIYVMENIINKKNGVKYVIPAHEEPFSGKYFNELKNLIKEEYDNLDNRLSAVSLLEKNILQFGIDVALQKFEKIRTFLNKTYYNSEQEYNTLGYRLFGLGKTNEAIGVFKISTEMFPTSANAYDNLAEAYLRKGNIKLAIENYKKSLEIFEGNKNAREILKLLKDRSSN